MATQANWEKEEVENLIELFQAEEDLWNISNANYSKKDFRMRALERVAESMGNKYTAEAINKKIIKLRSYYARELAKVRKTQKSGAGTDDLFKSKWPFFNQLDQFLRAQITPRGSMTNMDSQSIEDDLEGDEDLRTDDMSQSRTPTPTPIPTPVNDRKRKQSGPNAVLSEAVAVLSQLKNRPAPSVPTVTSNQDDEDAVFSRYLTNEIKKVQNQSARNNLKLSLQKQIFDAQKDDELTRQQPIWRPQLQNANETPRSANSDRLRSIFTTERENSPNNYLNL